MVHPTSAGSVTVPGIVSFFGKLEGGVGRVKEEV
jgi:hypothetical protein